MPLYRELDGFSGRGVRLLALSAVGAVLLVLSSCLLLPSLTYVAVWHPVWLDDEWIYHLREHDSDGVELWRQHPNGIAERVHSAIPGGCDGGAPRFLFRISGDLLGVGVECGESAWRIGEGEPLTPGTELFSYHTTSGVVEKIGALDAFATSAAVGRTRASPLLEVQNDCGSSVGLVRDDRRIQVLRPTGSHGTAWELVDASDPDCGRLAHSGSPAASWDGRSLYFTAAPATVGELPLEYGELDHLAVNLYVWDGDPKTLAVRQLGSLPAPAYLAVAPDGRRVAVTFGDTRDPGVLLVDASSGESTVLVTEPGGYDPAFAPDGKRLAYVKDLEEIVVVDLDRG